MVAMLRNLHPALKTGLAVLFLTQTALLRGGDRRLFINESASAWRLELAPSDPGRRTKRIAEAGDLLITLDGTRTRLGEHGTVTHIDLPAGCRAEVDFTHTEGLFYHLFTLTSLAPGSKAWTRMEARCDQMGPADANLPVCLVPSPPSELDLALYGKARADYLDPAKGGQALGLNAPEAGDLILKGPRSPRPTEVFALTNTTGEAWLMTAAPEPGKGTLEVAPRKPPVAYKVLKPGGSTLIQPGSGLLLRFGPDGGSFARTFTLAGEGASHGGPYTCQVKNNPGASWPEDVSIRRTPELSHATNWVRVDHFAREGYLEIEDPDSDVDWGEGVEDAF